MCLFNNTAHHYPIVIMVKSSTHMFAYSFFFSLYQLLNIFHRRLLLLLQRWMAVVRSTLCLNVHQPQSFINDERRRKRISFFFLSRIRKEKERTVAGEHFYSLLRPFLCCTQQFANLFSITAANRTLSDVFFLLFCFAHIQVLLPFKCLPYGRAMSSTTD